MNLCTFGIHKWGKYSKPVAFKMTTRYIVSGRRISDTSIVNAQDRTCERCGKYHVRPIKD